MERRRRRGGSIGPKRRKRRRRRRSHNVIAFKVTAVGFSSLNSCLFDKFLSFCSASKLHTHVKTSKREQKRVGKKKKKKKKNGDADDTVNTDFVAPSTSAKRPASPTTDNLQQQQIGDE